MFAGFGAGFHGDSRVWKCASGVKGIKECDEYEISFRSDGIKRLDLCLGDVPAGVNPTFRRRDSKTCQCSHLRLWAGRKGLCCYFYDSLSVCRMNNESCMCLKTYHCCYYIPGISMEPRRAFLTEQIGAESQTPGRRLLTGASAACWMHSAARTNSPGACRVKGRVFGRDLTLPHTVWPHRPLTQCSHFRMTLVFF